LAEFLDVIVREIWGNPVLVTHIEIGLVRGLDPEEVVADNLVGRTAESGIKGGGDEPRGTHEPMDRDQIRDFAHEVQHIDREVEWRGLRCAMDMF
jgi:hypothetical protein